MKHLRDGINPAADPSGTGCAECLALGAWWLHLRRCTECGHIGCCDSSPNQHASKHHVATGHPIITSFEPGERWFYNYRTEVLLARSLPLLTAVHWINRCLDQPDGYLLTGKRCFTNRGASRSATPFACLAAVHERHLKHKRTAVHVIRDRSGLPCLLWPKPIKQSPPRLPGHGTRKWKSR
jgi:hypothetical protein